MAEFHIKGADNMTKEVEAFFKEVQRRVDLAAKTGKGKALDFIMYGKESGISPTRLGENGAVTKAARRLGIAPYHIYYRSFARGIKVNKPYASGMIRTNAIQAIDLLIGQGKAKEYYGYRTRKSNAIGKANRNKRRNIANSRAKAAKRAINGSGKLRVGKRSYRGVFIQDGSKRSSSPKVDKYYREKLGANSFKLGMINNPMMIMQKKDKAQPKPYPTKVVKIEASRVHSVVQTTARLASESGSKKITEIQANEVNKRLKKLGFKLV